MSLLDQLLPSQGHDPMHIPAPAPAERDRTARDFEDALEAEALPTAEPGRENQVLERGQAESERPSDDQADPAPTPSGSESAPGSASQSGN
ncbi:MAG: hypothetical protein CMJ83_11215, partial [Planctomycetes bacterium]|nr:hypothetical protein [Planctomycetota bacterium]